MFSYKISKGVKGQPGYKEKPSVTEHAYRKYYAGWDIIETRGKATVTPAPSTPVSPTPGFVPRQVLEAIQKPVESAADVADPMEGVDVGEETPPLVEEGAHRDSPPKKRGRPATAK